MDALKHLSTAEYIAQITAAPKPRKPRRHLEDTLHTQVAKYLSAVIAPPGKARAGMLWHSIESRARRSLREGAANKARGCIAGVPDILIVRNGLTFFIELKAPKGKVSREQNELATQLATCHINVFVCRSVEDVAQVLREAGVNHA